MLTEEIIEFNIWLEWDWKKEATGQEKPDQWAILGTVQPDYSHVYSWWLQLLELVQLPTLTTGAVDPV